jgi:hypothetical protein
MEKDPAVFTARSMPEMGSFLPYEGLGTLMFCDEDSRLRKHFPCILGIPQR